MGGFVVRLLKKVKTVSGQSESGRVEVNGRWRRPRLPLRPHSNFGPSGQTDGMSLQLNPCARFRRIDRLVNYKLSLDLALKALKSRQTRTNT